MTNNVPIYLIDKNFYEIKKLKSTMEIISHIITSHKKKDNPKYKFNETDIYTYDREDAKHYMFVENLTELKSHWYKFFPDEFVGQDIFLKEQMNLITFIEYHKLLFCIIGGNAFHIVVRYIDKTFGINMYSKIMNDIEDSLIAISARGITGSRSGIQEQFRTDFRLIDFGRFGKLPTEIILKLSAKTSKHYFDFLQSKPTGKIKLKVGSSFEIKKKVDFDELNKIIDELYTIYGLEGKEYLSSYSELNNEDRIVINNLKPLLLRTLFDDMALEVKRKKANSKRFSFDLCHPSNIVDFYGADYYQLTELNKDGKHDLFAATDDKDLIYSIIQKRAFELVGETSFINTGHTYKVSESNQWPKIGLKELQPLYSIFQQNWRFVIFLIS